MIHALDAVRTVSVAPARSLIAPVVRRFDLRMMGGFRLSVDGQPVALTHHAGRLVAFLALRGSALDRLAAASTLWLDSEEARAAASLRTTLWKIRLVSPDLVVADGRHLRLAPGLTTDVQLLDEQARCFARTNLPLAGPEPSVDVLAGDLLPDWYDDWVIAERERLRQQRLHLLEAWCRHLSGLGRHAEAIDAGQAAVAGEPLRESAQAALIAAHVAEGNRSEALRQFELYRMLLDDELGIAPSASLRALVSDLALAR
jgi:DNA-binding SARP family transcriptional activator